MDHESLILNAKGAGQYQQHARQAGEAIAAGDEALMLNDAGCVAEGTGENLFLVRDGVVRTSSIAGNPRRVQGECHATSPMTGSVVEDPITRSDLYYADEAFFTGTAAEAVADLPDRRPRGGPALRSRHPSLSELSYMSACWARTRPTAIGSNSSRGSVGQQPNVPPSIENLPRATGHPLGCRSAGRPIVPVTCARRATFPAVGPGIPD